MVKPDNQTEKNKNAKCRKNIFPEIQRDFRKIRKKFLRGNGMRQNILEGKTFTKKISKYKFQPVFECK